ncbi:energy transducer TonB [uncultured Croceicoccus sp.]|uniref:energy transducer TonB n=1 Tax=uncultured Croceicoccus sp. TaxID=1295329 RepID=UPI0026166000|nr:energy transducer TonB [uncultured Croceicoccus sp.]
MYLHSGNSSLAIQSGTAMVPEDRPARSAPATPASMRGDVRSEAPVAPSGYRAATFDWRSVAAVGAIHAVAFAGLLTLGVVADRAEPVPIVQSFDIPLAANAPAPTEPVATPEPDTPPDSRAPATPAGETVAPVPRIALARTATPVANVPVMPIALPPMPAAAPGPAAPTTAETAPAPITPPDVAAAQRDNPAPEYPFIARRAREEGTVLLRVLVDPSGRVDTLKIAEGSRSSRLDEAALRAVRKWKFKPATQTGRAVAAWVVVPITFSLNR